MKVRFSTLDIIAILPELKSKLCTGWRVNQVYDCDYKTYIFKLNKSIVKMKKDEDPVSVDEQTANKMNFIIESGLRMHTTDYDWPKSPAPGQFATKLRKFIRNKRIEDIKQLGVDRIVDMQFGSSHLANHLIVELYDRGNLILTDSNYVILAILRWRKPGADHSSKDEGDGFKVGQTYPLERCRKLEDLVKLTEDKIVDLMNNSKILIQGNYKKRNKAKQQNPDGLRDINLKDLLNPHVTYGSSLLEDKLLKYLTTDDRKYVKPIVQVKEDEKGNLNLANARDFARKIRLALDEAEIIMNEVKSKGHSSGFIVQKTNNAIAPQKLEFGKKAGAQKAPEIASSTTNIDFFPILTCAERKIEQSINEVLTIQEYDFFDKAVDVYYCNLEAQKIDSKAFAAEKEARKKLENLKIAQEKRLEDLARSQKDDEEKGRLIELNSDQVENALLIIRSMLANQIPWTDIWSTIREAQSMKDPIASLITGVKFDRNEFTMKLSDPYDFDSDDKDVGSQEQSKNRNDKNRNGSAKERFKSVDIDISLSAYANARRFFVKRRTAVDKEKKTIEVSKKALKNVERRTKEMLKDVAIKTNITKARKRYWFENFFWFISTDGYLVVAGRDAEQNDLLVKRYMKNNDIYVHADLHGASTVIIKNEFATPVPPKTLEEAGTMAVCYSSAWDSKIATNSWWVYPNQVSKTAPAGEYLTTGAFMIRGKKNFLPLSNLVLGFGFLFRLGDESIDRRKEARRVREANSRNNLNEENQSEVLDDESSGEDVNQQGSSDSSSDEDNEQEPVGDTKPTSLEDKNSDSENDDEIDLEDENLASEYRLVDTLTESPMPDDVILYSIPMCGPYSAFQNFKYKVKVIPGANKRGKAAKACLGMFMHDKRAIQREKDLLRALKDQDYSRNIPNKVKISVANMKTLTKKKPKKSEVRLPI